MVGSQVDKDELADREGRKCNIRITTLPEASFESPEMLLKAVHAVASAAGVPTTSVRSARRLGPAPGTYAAKAAGNTASHKDTRPRAVQVILSAAEDRSAWLRGRKDLREDTALNMVRVNVDLTKQQLDYKTRCFPAATEAWNNKKKVRWMDHRLFINNIEYFPEQASHLGGSA